MSITTCIVVLVVTAGTVTVIVIGIDTVIVTVIAIDSNSNSRNSL